jgi:polar amino acid transport system substrate-binding protein
MESMRRSACAVLAVVGLLLAGCSGGDDDESAATRPGTAVGPQPMNGPATTAVPAQDPATCARGKTLTAGLLTVATGDPTFPPYVIDDDPGSGQGFEAAVSYAVAAQMGFSPDQVEWVRTTFGGALQAGPKDFDFNIQQYSITPKRSKSVTFSEPYYEANQAILGYTDSPVAKAATPAAIRDLRIGVAAGTTSLTFVTDILHPTNQPFIYNDNAAAKQALDRKQIDAIVADLPTALAISTDEIEGTTVFGQFPPSPGTEGEPWGLLFAKDNPLAACANLALSALRESGALDEITVEWMSGSVDAPEIPLD